MRAPILSGFGNSQPSKQGLSYLSDAGATPEAFGAGIGKTLGGLGESITEAGLKYEKRNEKTERFGALIGLSEFQTQTAAQLADLKRTVPPDVKDFPGQVNTLYTQREQAYLASLPPRLQPEFQFRARQIKQGIMLDALQFQYTQQDAFFVEGINKEYERAKNAIYTTPAEAAKWHQHMAETIASSDLPTPEKARLAREISAGLIAVEYGRDVEGATRGSTGAVTPQGTTPPNVQGAYAGLVKRGMPQMQAAVLAGNIEQESGGRPQAWNKDEGALGIIQWRLDRLTKLRSFAAQSGRAPADIDVQLDYLMKEGVELGSGQDKAAWAEFMAASTPEAANAALKKFIRYGDNSAGTRLSNARRLMGVDPGTIEVGPNEVERINSDPKYEGIPLEDRLAIQKDAQTKVDQEVADAVAEAKAAANAARNSLFVGLHDGTAGESELQAARNSGLISDVDDIEKAEKIMADRAKGLEDQQFMNGVFANGGLGYGTQDNDKFNGHFKMTKGAEHIAAMDTDHFNSVILPEIQTVQDIPTDLVGLLTTMSRSNNTDHMRWAFDRMLDLQDKATKAFDARMPDELAARVDQYGAMRNWAKPEQLNDFMLGGRNGQEVSINNALDTQARAILADPKSDVAEHIADPTELWEAWYRIDETGVSPHTRSLFSKEYQSAFIYNYRVTGEKVSAMNLTEKQIQRRWGPTTIGGRGRQLMRFPPEKAYPDSVVADGRKLETDWEAQARADLGLTEDESFELVSDQRTLQELEAYRGGATQQLPSYVAYKWTEDGRRIPMARWWGAAQ